MFLFSITWFLTYIYFIFAWDIWAAIEEILQGFLWREENSHIIEDQGGIMTYHKKVEDRAVYHWRFFGGVTFQHHGCILGTDLGRNHHGWKGLLLRSRIHRKHAKRGIDNLVELEWLDIRNTVTIPLYQWIENFKFLSDVWIMQIKYHRKKKKK